MFDVHSVGRRYRPAQWLFGAGLAVSLFGQPMTARAVDPDGLQRFEKLLPLLQAELKKNGGGAFSYAHGTAIGNSGFELDDVTLDVPADASKPDSKPTKATMKRLVVDDLDFARIDLAHPDAPTSVPYFVKMSVQGLTIDGDMKKQMSDLGLPPTSLDLAFDYRYDEGNKTLTLNKLALQLPGLASLDLALILDEVPPPGPETAKQAQDKTTLRTATLTYDDHSLLSRTLPIASAMMGMPIEQGIGMLRDTLSTMLKGQSAASVANGDALVSFAMDWKAPKGPLSVRLTPAAHASFAELKTIDTPDAAQKILGLAISYPGTQAGVATASAPAASTATATPAPASTPTPAPGPSAAAPSAAAPAANLCTVNNRVFVRDNDDGTLSAATVIEATGSGRCIVRMDGAAKGDDTVAAQNDLRRWSIDGPGDPLDACESGKSVLALSDGTWTPGKIKAKGGSGKCEVKFEDQDETEVLPLDSIRIATDR